MVTRPLLSRSGYRALLLLALIAGSCSAPRFVAPPASGLEAPVLGGVLHVRYRQSLHLQTDFDEHAQELATPLAAGDTVYAGSGAGVFYALAAGSGRARWAFDAHASISSRSLLEDGVLYFGSDDGVLHALDAKSGHERWSYRTKAPIHDAPAIAGDSLYVASADGKVFALKVAGGVFRWQYQREAPADFTIRGESRPLPAGDRVYAGFHDGYLVALSSAGGDVVWARPLGGAETQFLDVEAAPQIAGGVLYAGSYAGGLYALDPEDGGVRWRYDVHGAGTPIVDLADRRIYLAAPRTGLVCLDLAGHVIYQQATAGAGDPAPLVAVGPYLLLSTSEAGLYVARQDDGMLLQYFDPGSGISTSAGVANGRAFVLSNEGFLYALDFQAE